MRVEEIMSRHLVTIPLEGTLQDAVDRMLEHRVGSVIVTSGEQPTGIVTETDVLAAGSGFERPFADIPVSRAMSGGLVTVEPEVSLDRVVERMQEYSIKKLPVVEGTELVGIVTMTDLVYHHHDLAETAQRLEADREARDRPSE